MTDFTPNALVYIAAPYSSDPEANIKRAIAAGMKLMNAGFPVIVPHLCHYLHEQEPHEYEFWMQWCLSVLPRCTHVVRLPGHSAGADRETRMASDLGIEIYFSPEGFLMDMGVPWTCSYCGLENRGLFCLCKDGSYD